MNYFWKQGKTWSRRVIFLALMALMAAGFSLRCRPNPAGRNSEAGTGREGKTSGWVEKVSDGDTIVLSDGRKIRYLNIDCPEWGEPLFKEARSRNQALVQDNEVRLDFCEEKPIDRYGRWLAHVSIGDKNVGLKLLREGLAFLYIIPPCGLDLEKEMAEAARQAREKGRGIWENENSFYVPVQEASARISKHIITEGTVSGIYKNKKLAYLDIEEDGRRQLRLVVYKKYIPYFEAGGLDMPESYRNRRIRVWGRVREYRSMPVIYLFTPHQIEILDE